MVTSQAQESAEPLWCRATLNYSLPGAAQDETAPVTVDVLDGRRAGLPGWADCGFELMPHRSAVRDWDDVDEIAAVHYNEMSELARRLTGCDHALVSSHITRNPEQAARHADLGPISFVHSDFAASYDRIIREVLGGPGDEAGAARARAGITPAAVFAARRLLILQFWRNTGPAKMDLPLAFCDARSVAVADLKTLPVVDYAGEGFDFETLGVLAPAEAGRHRWYAFPGLRSDEVVAFRTYDSERAAQGQPFWTPHSAFDDPEVPLGQPSRRSIELRATCLFL